MLNDLQKSYAAGRSEMLRTQKEERARLRQEQRQQKHQEKTLNQKPPTEVLHTLLTGLSKTVVATGIAAKYSIQWSWLWVPLSMVFVFQFWLSLLYDWGQNPLFIVQSSPATPIQLSVDANRSEPDSVFWIDKTASKPVVLSNDSVELTRAQIPSALREADPGEYKKELRSFYKQLNQCFQSGACPQRAKILAPQAVSLVLHGTRAFDLAFLTRNGVQPNATLENQFFRIHWGAWPIFRVLLEFATFLLFLTSFIVFRCWILELRNTTCSKLEEAAWVLVQRKSLSTMLKASGFVLMLDVALRLFALFHMLASYDNSLSGCLLFLSAIAPLFLLFSFSVSTPNKDNKATKEAIEQTQEVLTLGQAMMEREALSQSLRNTTASPASTAVKRAALRL